MPSSRQGFSRCEGGWVVERSFAWIIRWRRLCRDHEGLPQSGFRVHQALGVPTHALAARSWIPVSEGNLTLNENLFTILPNFLSTS
jgi:hypothetical protein